MVVPAGLLGRREVGICRARIRDDEDLSVADRARLPAEFERRAMVSEDGTREGAVPGQAVETRDARPMRRQLFEQQRRGGGKFIGGELCGIAGRPLHHVGEAKAKVKQRGVMCRLKQRNAKARPGASAQRRA